MLSRLVQKYVMDCLKVASDNGIQNVQELSDGKSGAQVFRLKVLSRRPRNSGIYIVKCHNINSKWYTHSGSEAERCKQLHCNVPKSFKEKNRLVDLCHEATVGDQHVLIYRQANDSIIHSRSMDTLIGNNKITYLSLVAKELLTDFNADCLTDDSLLSTDINDFFVNTLDYRIQNTSGDKGTFYKKLDYMLDDSEADTIQIRGKLYPNPGYYLQKQTDWMDTSVTYNLRKGLMHGDLHSKNIICTDHEEPTYSIIDYDSFKEDGYLFFDHAYLELYMFLYECNLHDLESWENTLEVMLVPSLYSSVPVDKLPYTDSFAFGQIRNAICTSLSDWVKTNCPHFQDDFDVQFCLARIAAGINFFSKGGIQDYSTLLRILIYIGINLSVLFKRLSINAPQKKITNICDPEEKQRMRDLLWNNCVCKTMCGYIPVLITDDSYNTSEHECLHALAVVPWGLIWDCGNHVAPDDFGSAIRPEMIKHRHINMYTTDYPTVIKSASNSCIWLSLKKEEGKTYRSILSLHLKNIRRIWQNFLASNGLGPYIFIFDCKSNHPAAAKLQSLIEESIPRLHGSYLISLKESLFDNDLIDFYKENQCTAFNLTKTTLLDFAKVVGHYHGSSAKSNQSSVILPHLDSIDAIPLSPQEIAFYQTSVELIYNDMHLDSCGTAQDSIEFYRGNEISWNNIAHNYDLKLIPDYEQRIHLLQTQIEQGSPHIRIIKIKHGAGTGGTTLSKRVLWDLKSIVPTLRLQHYTSDTADIIIEIYNKCKKTVLLSVEMGSSVITPEDLVKLCDDVHARNARLWILQVERAHNTTCESEDKPFFYLSDTLPSSLAQKFNIQFKKLTCDHNRRQCLDNITNSNSPIWITRRCPFFYGFYTYEEDYHLASIGRTISVCSQEIKNLLSDMALGTIYSQNYIITTSELASRISGFPDDSPLLTVMEKIDSSVTKFIVVQNKGLRICHPIIAQKILSEIYSVSDYKDCLYQASDNFIENMHSLYGEDDDHIDSVLRELFIDRTEIDNEKMRFSILVQDIPEYTRKKELFAKLINYYPQNPHYYNHMSRLYVSQDSPDFGKAIELMDNAIQIARESGTASIHYVTLGSVYSKKIKLTLQAIQRDRKSGKYSPKIVDILEEIANDYQAANNAFTQSRMTGNPNSSYVYFPHILLEKTIIAQLVECDKKERNINTLFHEDQYFHAWYCEHYSLAVQILEEMQRNCTELISEAQQKIDEIDLNDSTLEDSLRNLIKTKESSIISKRVYATALYSRNHYSWHNLNQTELELIEIAMRQNLLGQFKGSVSRDVDFWFEAYRRLPYFDTDEAIQMLIEYKEECYLKEYLLSILYFQKLVKGVTSSQEVRNHIMACKNICPNTVNTTYWHDAYADDSKGCPIISKNDVRRRANGELVGLRFFTGTIQNISASSSGTILIDQLNIEATFLPIVTDENNNRREFTSQHMYARVKFNLMFSYSGLRAWNVTLS